MRKRKVGIMLLALAMLANIAAVVPTGTAAYASKGQGVIRWSIWVGMICSKTSFI